MVFLALQKLCRRRAPPKMCAPTAQKKILHYIINKAFRLIDLGACADLRTGANYASKETILDPRWCVALVLLLLLFVLWLGLGLGLVFMVLKTRL